MLNRLTCIFYLSICICSWTSISNAKEKFQCIEKKKLECSIVEKEMEFIKFENLKLEDESKKDQKKDLISKVEDFLKILDNEVKRLTVVQKNLSCLKDQYTDVNLEIDCLLKKETDLEIKEILVSLKEQTDDKNRNNDVRISELKKSMNHLQDLSKEILNLKNNMQKTINVADSKDWFKKIKDQLKDFYQDFNPNVKKAQTEKNGDQK